MTGLDCSGRPQLAHRIMIARDWVVTRWSELEMNSDVEVRKALHPGEAVLWTGKPDPWYAALYPSRSKIELGAILAAGFGIPAAAIAGLVVCAVVGEPAPIGGAILMVSVCLVFLGVSASIWRSHVTASKHFARVTYVVTDGRVLILTVLPEGGIEVDDLSAAGITMIETSRSGPGLSHLWLASRFTSVLGGSGTKLVGFLAIRDTTRVLDLISRLPCASAAMAGKPQVTRIE